MRTTIELALNASAALEDCVTGTACPALAATTPDDEGGDVGVVLVVVFGVVIALLAMGRVLVAMPQAIGALLGAGAALLITVTAIVLLIVLAVVVA
jgi:hypothetical protein